MKRFFAFFMTLALVVAMSVPAFAALGGFISSPTGVPAPELVEAKPASSDCNGKVAITSWADRHTLDDATKAKFEQAYNDITNTDSAFFAALKAFAEKKSIDVKDLAVGSFFDISYYNCTEHAAHEGFIITIKPEIAENAAGIAHLSANGWEILDVTGDTTLTFTVGELSPFAIVYNTNPGNSSETGDSTGAWIYVSIMVASVVAFGSIALTLKKREN